jgi:hypothetical protein
LTKIKSALRLRAAYCLGVLGEVISNFPQPDEKTRSEIAKGTATAFEVQIAEGFDALTQKRQRYYQYLAVQVIFGQMQTSILAIGEKGKSDYRQKTQGSTDAVISILRKCRTSCGDEADGGSWSECTIQCVAKQDQVYANVLKCVGQPDQLPF